MEPIGAFAPVEPALADAVERAPPLGHASSQAVAVTRAPTLLHGQTPCETQPETDRIGPCSLCSVHSTGAVAC